MDIQRLRNITTGMLHTKMDDVYKDIEWLTSSPGVMTHMLPAAARGLRIILQKRNLPERFWDGVYDPSHVGVIDVQPLSPAERAEFWMVAK